MNDPADIETKLSVALALIEADRWIIGMLLLQNPELLGDDVLNYWTNLRDQAFRIAQNND